MMLRSRADAFSVQHLLGHSDLAVLRRYLAQTGGDLTKAHELHFGGGVEKGVGNGAVFPYTAVYGKTGR